MVGGWLAQLGWRSMGKGVDEMDRHMHLYITYLTFILTRGAWPGLGCSGVGGGQYQVYYS
jgi:hypothetical protein